MRRLFREAILPVIWLAAVPAVLPQTVDREETRATSTQAGTVRSDGFVVRSLRMLESSASALSPSASGSGAM